MNNQISNETHVMVVTGFGRIYLTKKQAETVEGIMDDRSVDAIKIPGKGKYRRVSIHGVSPANQLSIEDRLKRGEWQCDLDTWHTKGQVCACKEAKRMGIKY